MHVHYSTLKVWGNRTHICSSMLSFSLKSIIKTQCFRFIEKRSPIALLTTVQAAKKHGWVNLLNYNFFSPCILNGRKKEE